MRGRVEPVPAISLLGGACMSYTFSLSRRSLPVRCLCLLLIVLVLWCFFMVPRAGAVALEASTVAYAGLLVGTLLVGAGVAFSNPGDMAKAGNAMYRTLQKGNEAIASKIAAISVWAVDHGKSVGSAALRIGKDLYQGIVDTFNASYSGGKFEISPSVASVQDFVSSNRSTKTFYIHTYYYDYGNYDTGRMRWYKVVWSSTSSQTQVKVTDLVDGREIANTSKGINGVLSSCYLDIVKIRDYTYLALHTTGTYSDGNAFDDYDEFAPYVRDDVFALSTTAPVSIPCTGDLAYPSDNSLVKLPDIPSVDVGTGEVTYPDNIAYTKDAVAAPYPIGDDGVKVPDIPYDIPVDQTSGKPMDDTGTDTDTPSKPGEGTDTGSNTGLLQKILDLLKNFFDSPSDFRLNMDGFRNLAIADKFPFCIPFDLVDSIKQFAVTAKDFHFRIKLDTHYFKIDHEVDLSDMVLPFAFFRYMVLVWFVWMLMLRTRDLVKW